MEMLGQERATVTFPLNSKRLQLHQLQKIAAALDLPTTALGSDLLVIVSWKLCDIKHEPSNVQVVATKLRKEKNCHCRIWMVYFLRVPVFKEELSRESPASGSEVSVPVLESGSSRTSPIPYSG